MPLTLEQQELVQSVFKECDPFEPLQPNDRRYEPVYAKLGTEDPVELLKKGIQFSPADSMQLFSGYRGSGKSSELKRLRSELEKAASGYVVYEADAMEYINPGEPIDIVQLLMVLAGAFSDAIDAREGVDPARESYWTRLVHFLTTTNVVVEGVEGKAAGKTPLADALGGLETSVSVKLALKDAPSFKQKLAKFMENRIGEVKAHVGIFFQDCIKQLKLKHGENTRVVFLFDNLEALRGSLSNETDVFKSVSRLFRNHIESLKISFVHLVLTVPAWLRIVAPNVGNAVRLLPTIKMWENDSIRTETKLGRATMLQLLRRRLDFGKFEEFFGLGASGEKRAEMLISVCGGHFRDLLKMMQGLALRVGSSLPVDETTVNSAINEQRRQFLPIALDDAKWLYKIGQERETLHSNTEPDEINRLMRFFDSHCVMYFTNGDDWYDIHPLIREEVVKLNKIAEPDKRI